MSLGPIELVIILVLCAVLLVLPVVAAILLARRPKAGRTAWDTQNGSDDRTKIDNARRRPCPFCAELILPEARVCRYCGRDLPQGWL